MNDRDTIINRIKKCFALGKSPNEHEAAAALAKARALMDEYGISTADILASKASECISRSGAKYRPPSWEGLLSQNICEMFGCQTIYLVSAWSWSRSSWSFVGCGPNPQIAKYAFDVLLRQVRKARTQYIKTRLRRCKSASRKTRRADMFCFGWVTAASSKALPMVVSEEDSRAIQAFLADRHPQTGNLSMINRCKRHSAHGLQDFISGRVRGNEAILEHGVEGHPMERRALMNL